MSRVKRKFSNDKLEKLVFPPSVEDYAHEEFMGFSYVGENYHKQDNRATQEWMALNAFHKEQVK